MPEFVQPKKRPYAQIVLRFRNEDDLQEFGLLIGQPVTAKTKSLWHPVLARGEYQHCRYVDGEPGES